MTNVLIVEDERNVTKGFRADIDSAADRYTCVAAIENASNAATACSANHIDLILMDINTKDNESGLVATEQVKRLFPSIKVIITTSYLDFHAIEEARRMGADSVWLKDLSPIELLDVMDATMRGESYFPEKQPNIKIGNIYYDELTATEKEVLALLIPLVNAKKIAAQMCVEESTIKTHLLRMCRKVGCKNKQDLAILASNCKLVLPGLKTETK